MSRETESKTTGEMKTESNAVRLEFDVDHRLQRLRRSQDAIVSSNDAEAPLVLHVITNLRRAGAESQLLKLLTHRSPRFQHQVLSLGSLLTLAPEFERIGVGVHSAKMRIGLPRLRDILRYRKMLNQLSPQIVQGWMYHGNLAACMAHKQSVVCWNIRRSLDDLALQKRTLKMTLHANRLLSPRADAIVYNARRSMSQHQQFGFASANSHYLPNGFELPSLNEISTGPWRGRLGIPHGAVVFGLLGRFHPVKNHAMFLRAASRLRDSNAFFVMAGENVDGNNAQIQRLIAQHGLEARCFAMGEVAHGSEFLAEIDCLVSTSISEGFPNVVGEAMAHRLPCIVTDVGESASLIDSSGAVVPVDQDEALAGEMLRIAQASPLERMRIGQQARDRIERSFSIEAVAGLYDNLYTDLLNRRFQRGSGFNDTAIRQAHSNRTISA